MLVDTIIPFSQAQPPLVLALDIGTSSVRAVFFDRLGRMLDDCLARQPVRFQTAPDGTATIDADELFSSTCNCIDEVLGAFHAALGSKPVPIAGVGSCSFVGNVLGVNREGFAVTPIFTYADTRPAPDVADLRKIVDEDTAHQRTGCLFHTSYLPARILWIVRTQPELLRPDLRWMSFGEYFALRLFGETAVSYSAASWTGLLNQHLLTWDEELLRVLPIHIEQLSLLVDVDKPWHNLSQEYSRRWPALQNVPWFPTIGDGAAANIGSGCVSEDKLALTMGTTTALRIVLGSKVPQIPRGLWRYRVDRQVMLLGGALSEGGGVLEWLQRLLRHDQVDDLEIALSTMSPDGHGLTFLPLLSGERSPGWVGEARGAILGLSQATGQLDVLRAGMEGVAFRIRIIWELLRGMLPDPPEIIASGGAIQRSPAWAQIIADVLGQPITLSDTPEASARGVAMLAFRSLGVVADLKEFPFFFGRNFQPDMVYNAIYQVAFERQQALYHHVIETLQSSSPKKDAY